MGEVTTGLTPVQRLLRLLKPDYKDIRNVYVYSVFNGLVNLSLPLGIQAIVNLIQGGQVSTSWVLLVILVVFGVAVTGILQIQQMRITEDLQQKIFARASFEFAYRIPRIKMEALYKHYAPELVNRFFDTVSAQKGLSKILIDFSVAIFSTILGLILLCLYHPFFILFSAVLVIIVFIIIRFTAKRGMDTSLKESKYKYQVAHWLEELARVNTSFKLAGDTQLPMDRTDGEVTNYLSARESHFKVLLQQYTLSVVFKVLLTAGLLAIGGYLVIQQHMNIGQFVAAEIVILMVMNSVEKLILSMETIYDVLTALAKLGQVTDLELEQTKGINLVGQSRGGGLDIELSNASFNYPTDKRQTLDNMSLKIKSGERLLITGANGAGKSTLLHILAGLYDVKEGTIAYNGLPKGNLELSSLRELMGDYLSQELVFQGTVLENITMGRKNINFDQVQKVVERLGLNQFIKTLPNGYETMLDPEGSKLPRSISQKILLARSVVHKPKLLLLENAFNYLDEQDYKSIVDFLISKENEWTMVIVSSDAYLAQRSDRVVIMRDGKIVKSGTYDEVKTSANFKSNGNA